MCCFHKYNLCRYNEWRDGGPEGGLAGYTCKQQSTCQGNYKTCNPDGVETTA
jgi:hypothetical protein